MDATEDEFKCVGNVRHDYNGLPKSSYGFVSLRDDSEVCGGNVILGSPFLPSHEEGVGTQRLIWLVETDYLMGIRFSAARLGGGQADGDFGSHVMCVTSVRLCIS